MQQDRTPSLTIVFAPNQDPAQWSARFERGAESSRWPYSLESLGARFETTTTTVPRPGPWQLARLLLALAFGPSHTGETDFVLTWDENLAARSMAAVAGNARISGLIWATDDDGRGRSAIKRWVLRAILRRCAGIFVVSRAQLSATRAWLKKPSVVLEWIPLGIEPGFFPERPYPDWPLVISLGNDRDREPAALAAALLAILRERPDTEVIVQSDRPEVFPPTIRVVPHVTTDELRDLYARASVVVLTTRPNLHLSGLTVALETMSSGRPVVMNYSPGIEDYVRNGTSGYLTQPGDAEEMAARVIEILDSPALGKKLGLAGRALVESEFSAATMNESLARFIASVPSRAAAPDRP